MMTQPRSAQYCCSVRIRSWKLSASAGVLAGVSAVIAGVTAGFKGAKYNDFSSKGRPYAANPIDGRAAARD